MPDETVIDGEVVALDGEGKPSFNSLQNYGSPAGPLLYYVFDVMILSGKDVMGETLETRRSLLEKHVLPKLREPIRYSPELQAALPDISSIRSRPRVLKASSERDARVNTGPVSGLALGRKCAPIKDRSS